MADNSNVTEMNVVNKDPTTISSMQNIISESNMSDVLLVAGGKKFPTNRMLLSACSEYFEKMFTGSFAERDAEEVVMHNLTANVLEILLNVCHTGNLLLEDSMDVNAVDILKGAHFLQLTTAIELSSVHLLGQLNAENCLSIWLLGKHLSLPHFAETVFHVCVRNFSLLPSSNVLQLSGEQFIELLASPDISVNSEVIIMYSVGGWILNNPKENMQYYPRLSSYINFQLIDMKSFSEYIHSLETCEDSKSFVFNLMKDYITSCDKKKILKAPKKSTFALLSLYPNEIYLQDYKNVTDPPSTTRYGFMERGRMKTMKIIAVHIEDYVLYLVARKENKHITVDFFDLSEPASLPFRKIKTAYREAAAIFQFPKVYFVGINRVLEEKHLINARSRVIAYGNTVKSVARIDPGLAIMDNVLYIIGGEEDEDRDEINYVQSVEVCELRKFIMIWESCPPMMFPVKDISVSVHNGKIFVVGVAVENSPEAGLTKIQYFDSVRRVWNCMDSPFNKLCNIKSCIWQNSLVVTGIDPMLEEGQKHREAGLLELDKKPPNWKPMTAPEESSFCSYMLTASNDYLTMLK